jgi:hypothetical protein
VDHTIFFLRNPDLHHGLLDDHRPRRFRVRGDIDETIPSDGPSDYFKFWGLEYIVETDRRVYDLARQLLLDEPFNTLDEHWAEWSRRAELKLPKFSETPHKSGPNV